MTLALLALEIMDVAAALVSLLQARAARLGMRPKDDFKSLQPQGLRVPPELRALRLQLLPRLPPVFALVGGVPLERSVPGGGAEPAVSTVMTRLWESAAEMNSRKCWPRAPAPA